jgi:hypothetical protein
MEIKSYKRVVEERHAISVETIDLGNDRNLFSYREEITRTGAKDKLVEKQGVATARQLVDLRAGRETKFERYTVFTDEAVAGIRQFGYSFLHYDDYKCLKGTGVDRPFDHAALGGSLDNLIRLESYDHSFWKIDGSLFPAAIAFDYVEASITDRRYDLKKLVEILRQREDVTIIAAKEGGYRRRSEGLTPAQPGEEIDRIPYYNRDCGSETVTFYWTPPAEVTLALRSTEGKKGFFNRFHYIFDNDLLGLRAGGAALTRDFYGNTLLDGSKAPERDYDDGDDD